MKNREEKGVAIGFDLGLGGILKGVADLVEKLGDLAETGDTLTRGGEFQGKEVKGVYGLNVRFATGGTSGESEFKVEPFGNIGKDKAGRTVVEEYREPIVDVFEEDGHLLVVAEMPGIALEDVKTTVQGKDLRISAERGAMKYRKLVTLPEGYGPEPKTSWNNGIVEIKLFKQPT